MGPALYLSAYLKSAGLNGSAGMTSRVTVHVLSRYKSLPIVARDEDRVAWILGPFHNLPALTFPLCTPHRNSLFAP